MALYNHVGTLKYSECFAVSLGLKLTIKALYTDQVHSHWLTGITNLNLRAVLQIVFSHLRLKKKKRNKITSFCTKEAQKCHN